MKNNMKSNMSSKAISEITKQKTYYYLIKYSYVFQGKALKKIFT